MTTYLVRHGQSEWNVAGLLQGQAAAPPLTALGREQAQTAAERVSLDADRLGLEVVEVATSDLVRAQQTAELVAEHLGCPVTIDPRLREQHLGRLEGTPSAQAWAALADHDWADLDLPVAGGETPREVRHRMAAALDDSRPVPGSASVLVSHGDAVRALLSHLDEAAGRPATWHHVPNGAVARLEPHRITWL